MKRGCMAYDKNGTYILESFKNMIWFHTIWKYLKGNLLILIYVTLGTFFFNETLKYIVGICFLNLFKLYIYIYSLF